MQLVLDHKRHNCRDLHHLVAQRLRIVTRKSGAAAPTARGMVGKHLLALLKQITLDHGRDGPADHRACDRFP
mgnify:FL=1|jgi:hypothetical protein